MPAFASTEELQVKIAITIEELSKKLQSWEFIDQK